MQSEYEIQEELFDGDFDDKNHQNNLNNQQVQLNPQQVQNNNRYNTINDENEFEQQFTMYQNVRVFTIDEASSTILLPYTLLKQQTRQNRTLNKILNLFFINQLSKLGRRITSYNQNRQAFYCNTRQNLILQKTISKKMIFTNTEYQKLESDFTHFVFT